MDAANTIQIRFAGGGITPQTIKSKDLAEIASSFEQSIIEIILQQNPSLIGNEIAISLVQIDEGSAKFRFISSIVLGTIAFTTLTDSISTNQFDNLPPRALEVIRTISKFTQVKNCVAEFRSNLQSNEPLAIINPETQKSLPKVHFINGETTLYGTVEKVGGAEPRVVLRLSGKETISCETTPDIAKNLGKRLYEFVGVQGRAKWQYGQTVLESFKINEILEYKESPIVSAMKELATIVQPHWAKKGANELIAEIRGGE
jgi:Fe-S cluster biosynthesis and repair protein YggX